MTCAHCEKYTHPKSLNEEDIVDIHIEQDDGSYLYEGRAILKRHLESWFTPEPFPILERCPVCKIQINHIKEKWLVHWTGNPFIEGREAVRWISRFFSKGLLRVNLIDDNPLVEFIEPYCRDELGDAGLAVRLRHDLLRNNVSPLLAQFLLYMQDD